MYVAPELHAIIARAAMQEVEERARIAAIARRGRRRRMRTWIDRLVGAWRSRDEVACRAATDPSPATLRARTRV